MAIDDSGQWWIGSAPTDIEPYLKAYASESYEVHAFRLARCGCGGEKFRLLADDEEGVAQRTCIECDSSHFICDSAEYWSEARPEKFVCVECKNDSCNVGVGFSLYEDKSAIKWLYVGERCAECGVLGCMAGWKVGYEPSLQLVDQV